MRESFRIGPGSRNPHLMFHPPKPGLPWSLRASSPGPWSVPRRRWVPTAYRGDGSSALYRGRGVYVVGTYTRRAPGKPAIQPGQMAGPFPGRRPNLFIHQVCMSTPPSPGSPPCLETVFRGEWCRLNAEDPAQSPETPVCKDELDWAWLSKEGCLPGSIQIPLLSVLLETPRACYDKGQPAPLDPRSLSRPML